MFFYRCYIKTERVQAEAVFWFLFIVEEALTFNVSAGFGVLKKNNKYTEQKQVDYNPADLHRLESTKILPGQI